MSHASSSYWLLKTEPEEWSWDHQISQDGFTAKWDGVKNPLAQKHMKSMQLGDLCFFYHSGRKSREIVGIVNVSSTWTPEEPDTDKSGKLGCVMVKALMPLPKRVSLDAIKREDGDGIKDFVLLRQQRLSVVPVTSSNWAKLCEMGEVDQGVLERAVKEGLPPEELKLASNAPEQNAPDTTEGDQHDESADKETDSRPRKRTKSKKEEDCPSLSPSVVSSEGTPSAPLRRSTRKR